MQAFVIFLLSNVIAITRYNSVAPLFQVRKIFFHHVGYLLKNHETVESPLERCTFKTNIYGTFHTYRSRKQNHNPHSFSDFKADITVKKMQLYKCCYASTGILFCVLLEQKHSLVRMVFCLRMLFCALVSHVSSLFLPVRVLRLIKCHIQGVCDFQCGFGIFHLMHSDLSGYLVYLASNLFIHFYLL